MWWPRRQGVRGLLLGQGAPGRSCAGTVPAQGTGDTGGHISTEPRINERIRVPEVRLVGPAGEQIGIVAINDALRLAQEADLDLVEVAPTARPPVAKLMDYGKFKYESALKARESRKNQAQTVIKEIKLRPKIDPHDYGTKKGHVERFLKAGDKVKVTIMFRGREQSRPELGYKLLQRLAGDVDELGFVEAGAQAGRPQHDHGDRAAQAQDRDQAGRPARAQRTRKSDRAERQAARTAASVAAGSPRASAPEPARPGIPGRRRAAPRGTGRRGRPAASAARPRQVQRRRARPPRPRPGPPFGAPELAAPRRLPRRPRPASPRPAAPGAAARPAPRPASAAGQAAPPATGAPASPGGTASPSPRPSAPRPAPPRPSPAAARAPADRAAAAPGQPGTRAAR